MSLEDPGSVSFAGIGGLGDQVRELREVIELPLMNPELFEVSPQLFPYSSCLPFTRHPTSRGPPRIEINLFE
jgi:SpoVK/Ycf46/Vps4 family AAA+-type ATPase